LIANELELLGITHSRDALIKLSEFAELVKAGNKRFNLTAIKEDADFAKKHFADSLSVLKLDDIAGAGRLIDIGSGAGFPGVPLAIMMPQTNVLMVDSTNKKIEFILSAIEKLGLKNAQAIAARAEDIAHNPLYREKFDIAVSRAVAPLNVLTEMALPFVKKGGVMIAYKGTAAMSERIAAQKAAEVCGGKIHGVYPSNVSELDHYFVVIKKIKETDGFYPRNFSAIKKKPIV